VLFEDLASTMAEDDHHVMRSIFTRELASSSVIAIGTSPGLSGFYDRTIRLRRIEDEAGAVATLTPYLAAAE
jgi:hypothetical protein